MQAYCLYVVNSTPAAAIGAITFSGSVIAFGKLSGTYKFRLFKGAPVVFAGQHLLNLVLGLSTIALGLLFMATGSWPAFYAMLAVNAGMANLLTHIAVPISRLADVIDAAKSAVASFGMPV